MMTTENKRQIQEVIEKCRAEIERDQKAGKVVGWKEKYLNEMREAWEKALERMERQEKTRKGLPPLAFCSVFQ